MKVTQKLLRILNKYSDFPIDADFFLVNTSTSIQKKLAPILRRAAIDNLRQGQGVVARAFRGEYVAAKLGSVEEFLVEQEKNSAWATYIEAESLGELLGFHVTVIPEKNNRQQEAIALYRAESDSAHVLQLFNKDNVHWYAADNRTLGDGNCLYNALAENLQRLVIQELPPPVIVPVIVKDKKEVSSVSISKQSFFAKEENDVLQSQAAILRAIQKAPKPSEIEQQLQADKERFDHYPLEVQNQIRADFLLSIKVAREEMQAFHQSKLVTHSFDQYSLSPVAAAA